VHVCASHLAVLRRSRGLLVIRDFKKVISGCCTVASSILHIELPDASPTRYLAVSDGRIAAATVGRLFFNSYFPITDYSQRDGVYVLTLSPERRLPESAMRPSTNILFPYVTLSGTHRFLRRCPHSPTCLQLTERLLLSTCNPGLDGEQSTVLSIDASPSER
jgi:hypothetical protein